MCVCCLAGCRLLLFVLLPLLLFSVLLPAPVSGTRFQVRVWQPSIDTSKITEPFRFWELVEWRRVPSSSPSTTTTPTTEVTTTPSTTRSTSTSTSTTTTTTAPPTTTITTTTTTTEPSTVSWEIPTTPLLCDASDPEILMKRMKDSGVYNEIYMAADFYSASRNFPNLSGRQFMRPKPKYTCDDHCKRSSNLVRLVMNGEDSAATDTPQDPPRTWWDSSKWESEQRSKRQAAAAPSSDSLDKTKKRKQLEHTIMKALKELKDLDNEKEETDKQEYQDQIDNLGDDEADNVYNDKDFDDFNVHTRFRRSRPPIYDRASLEKNSGITKDVLGTTIAIDCQENNEKGFQKSGYHFCSTCRAIRHLPRNYFPRILNEIICSHATCVRGDGRCAQRFLQFKVLRNEGTEACPKWNLISIDIRTCCDCIVHPMSPFVRYLQTN